jgi:sec-independent protein translocase protein TatA
MFGRVGSTEVIVVLAILVILFGGKKLPELAKGMGEALKEFKKALAGEEGKKKSQKGK